MASSSFSTELKVGKNVNNIAKNENFAILGNYKVLLQKWMKVFGKENIIVRLFDKNEFYQG
ncbi:hypothetical protein ACMTGT_001608, partial [Campylobacter coli]